MATNNPSADAGATEAAGDQTAEARQALARVLAAAEFPASERRQELLRYIVEHSLAGHDDHLTARAIATAVLDRDGDFDPQTDPIVRLEVSRLRRDLHHYYGTDGANDPIRIGIPKGHYVATIEQQAKPVRSSPQQTVMPDGNGPASGRTGRRLPLVVPAAALLLGLALLSWFFWPFGRAPAGAFVAQTEPAVIVQPFKALDGGREGRLLAVGIVDGLIGQLMRFDGVDVYAGSAAGVDDHGFPPSAAGLPRYVVTGTVRRQEDLVRISARLSEYPSGRALWSDSYDRALGTDAIFAIEDDLAASIASRLAQPYGTINAAEAAHLHEARPETLFAYDCVQQALLYRQLSGKEAYSPAVQCLEESVKRDPDYADAWAMLALLQLDAVRFGFVQDASEEQTYAAALRSAERAVSLAPERARSLQALAVTHFMRGEFEEAEDVQRRAITINPNDPEGLAELAWRLLVRGKVAEGKEVMQRAIDRSVRPPPWYFTVLAMAFYLEGALDEAVDAARAGREFCCGPGPAVLAIAEAAVGHAEEAREALDEAIVQMPVLASDPSAMWRLFKVIEPLSDRLTEGLVSAGLKRAPTGS